MRARFPTRCAILAAAVFLVPILLPSAVSATQAHPAAEGVAVHQLGHVFFAISMGFLIFWLRQRGLVKLAGWRLIQYSAFFFILWNLDAMLVHYIEDMDDVFEVLGIGQWHQWIHVIGGHTNLSLIYYLGRLDHLLCVPAILLLYFGLKRLLQAQSGEALPERRP